MHVGGGSRQTMHDWNLEIVTVGLPCLRPNIHRGVVGIMRACMTTRTAYLSILEDKLTALGRFGPSHWRIGLVGGRGQRIHKGGDYAHI